MISIISKWRPGRIFCSGGLTTFSLYRALFTVFILYRIISLLLGNVIQTPPWLSDNRISDYLISLSFSHKLSVGELNCLTSYLTPYFYSYAIFIIGPHFHGIKLDVTCAMCYNFVKTCPIDLKFSADVNNTYILYF